MVEDRQAKPTDWASQVIAVVLVSCIAAILIALTASAMRWIL